MSVYLLTAHAYRSWSENDDRGYVQRDEGLQLPSGALAAWRDAAANHPPMRFDKRQQEAIHSVVNNVVPKDGVDMHACATTCTHVHALISFRSPACACGAACGAAALC